jgi:hypothetical protein
MHTLTDESFRQLGLLLACSMEATPQGWPLFVCTTAWALNATPGQRLALSPRLC